MAGKKLAHGGDWAGFEMEYGRPPLDFSMNVNPLGMAKEVQEAIAAAAAAADRYPDPLCRDLTRRLAEGEGVPPEWIFCGNGAADIIFRLARALKPGFREARDGEEAGRAPVLLVTAPTFSEYETAFGEYGWEVRRHLLKEEEGFRLGEDFLEAIDGRVDAVFLCEPNNPTGVTTDRALLGRILERCRRTGTRLVVDECFNGFLEDPRAHTLMGELIRAGEIGAGQGDLIILKAFTKLYGMAGVRLGYCICADTSMVEEIRRAGPPWNVSSLAQAAGAAALEAEDHVVRGQAIVREEGRWLRLRLRDLGIHRVYGEANYLLFHRLQGSRTPSGEEEAVPGGGPASGQEAADRAKRAAEPIGADRAKGIDQAKGSAGPIGVDEEGLPLDEAMRRRGVLIRNCSNYPGLGPGWYRIAVRTRQENELLIRALGQSL